MNEEYRAAVIGLGRMGSTIDDERGKWAHHLFPTGRCWSASARTW